MAAIFTDENFQTEVLQSQIPVLVDFFAVWCGPCQMMAPVLEKLSGEFSGKVKIGKVDVEQSPAIASQFGIMSIPAFKIFKNGEVAE